jgi:hypothetical protein
MKCVIPEATQRLSGIHIPGGSCRALALWIPGSLAMLSPRSDSESSLMFSSWNSP